MAPIMVFSFRSSTELHALGVGGKVGGNYDIVNPMNMGCGCGRTNPKRAGLGRLRPVVVRSIHSVLIETTGTSHPYTEGTKEPEGEARP
jgi:hypothetical protein